MNYLVNIYNMGLIVETHVLSSEEKALEAFNAYTETIEDVYEKCTCFFSYTPTGEELTEAEPKKKTKNK